MNKVAFINVFKAPSSTYSKPRIQSPFTSKILCHKCAGNIIRLEQIIFGVPENRLETGAIVPSARNRVVSYFSTSGSRFPVPQASLPLLPDQAPEKWCGLAAPSSTLRRKTCQRPSLSSQGGRSGNRLPLRLDEKSGLLLRSHTQVIEDALSLS